MGCKKSNHIMIQNKLMKSPILKLKPKSDTILIFCNIDRKSIGVTLLYID